MPVQFVQLFSIPVSNQDRAKAFYRDVLGFTVAREMQMGPDARWVQLSLPDAQTSITLVTWFPSMPPGSLKGLVLETSDVDADSARIRELDITVGDVQEQPWGRFVELSDPDGNGIILQQTAYPG